MLDQGCPGLRRLFVAALEDDDRPGFGFAAECRAGWAARHTPPRLGPSSVADPLAGLLAAHTAAALLAGAPGRPVRLTLETAVGHLLGRRPPGGGGEDP